jgi:CheY-like chemotaxis protein
MLDETERRKLTVLMVDDDRDILTAASVGLKREGYTVLSATSGEEGLELALKETPDIIILDVQMPPGMGGPEVCRALRERPDTARIPILFLTGKVDLDAMEETIEDNAQGYILKPFSVYDLLVRIDEVLSE